MINICPPKWNTFSLAEWKQFSADDWSVFGADDITTLDYFTLSLDEFNNLTLEEYSALLLMPATPAALHLIAFEFITADESTPALPLVEAFEFI